MFTIEQIYQAHRSSKSGADFPAFIREIIKLGVIRYETYVSDGHTIYFGLNNFKISSSSTYDVLMISETSDVVKFKADLKAHQFGKTNFQIFCDDCAKSGIEKWLVDTETMTCTYFDTSGNEILAEQIPQ
jgi:uncharacterized protein YbcV (DUF1398 family)